MGRQPRDVTADPARLARLSKSEDGHKYAHGHALVLSGGPGRTGAARLAARGALRVGAGLVTLGVPPAAQLECAAQLTAIMLTRIDGPEALAETLSDDRLNALCLGPGLGVGEGTRALVGAALRAVADTPGRGAVLDADALTSFEDAPDDLFGALTPDCVLTPHEGEFRRLFPDLAAALEGDRGKAVREAAGRAGAVVLLKGPVTLIGRPDGRLARHDATGAAAVPWLATAGSGDVLAGIVAGLIARGLPAAEAAETGTLLHAAAGRRVGPGLIAEDLPEALPGVLRDLGV